MFQSAQARAAEVMDGALGFDKKVQDTKASDK